MNRRTVADAQSLHQDSLVVVAHDHNPIGTDTDQMLAGGVTAKVYQIGVDVEIGAGYLKSAMRRDGFKAGAEAEIAKARAAIEADSRRLTLALCAADVEQAKRDGKVAIILGVEGAKLLEGDTANLRHFYDLGLRELQLCWAVPNQVVERESLTDFGRTVIAEAQNLGMIADLTHIHPTAFTQAVEVAHKPLIVSHGTPWELGSAGVKAIADSGGVVGIHFYSSYLGEQPTVSRAIDAIDDLIQQGGIQSAALGIDLFPTDNEWGDFQRAHGTQNIAWAIPDLGHLPDITRSLVTRGYQDDDIRAILGGNYLRVMKQALGNP